MTSKLVVLIPALVLIGSGVLCATGLEEYLRELEELEETEETEETEEISSEETSTTETEELSDLIVGQENDPEIIRSQRTGPVIEYPLTLFLSAGPSVLGNVEIVDFIAAIEADRRLLAEMRKQVPGNRIEAEIYLARLKDLAEHADPMRLAPKANRVLEQAIIYYNWLETEFESAEEEIYEYYIGGAQGFSRALEEFENAVLMTAMNRLDIAARILLETYSVPLE
ncbi:MAG: hypothetical protein V3S41_02750 [Spirochaetia bacterium]